MGGRGGNGQKGRDGRYGREVDMGCLPTRKSLKDSMEECGYEYDHRGYVECDGGPFGTCDDLVLVRTKECGTSGGDGGAAGQSGHSGNIFEFFFLIKIR